VAQYGKTERIGGLVAAALAPAGQRNHFSYAPASNRPVCISACASGDNVPSDHLHNQLRHPSGYLNKLRHVQSSGISARTKSPSTIICPG
jgi:hypothetical protein